MSIFESAAGVPDQILDAIKVGQDAILSVVDSLVERASPITEKLPASPFADQLPNLVEVTENGYTFAQKLLASQKDFALKLAQVYSPAQSANATKSAAKAAPKAA
jgi:hypothetical protein